MSELIAIESKDFKNNNNKLYSATFKTAKMMAKRIMKEKRDDIYFVIVNDDQIDISKLWLELDKEYHSRVFMEREVIGSFLDSPLVPKQVICNQEHPHKKLYPIIKTQDPIARSLHANFGDVIKSGEGKNVYYRLVG